MKILDLCCGSGRHLIPLNELGFHVDGVDINKEYIGDIYKKIENWKNKPRLYVENIEEFSNYDGLYDLIYSIESSIGYLSDSDTVSIFQNVYKILTDQGKFVLHLINREYLIKKLEPRMWFGDEENGYCLEERELDLINGIIRINQRRIFDGHVNNYNVDLRLYSL